ncbi:MAG: GreA/GreB family elongation factor [Polyangiaceae bacterium]
MIPDKRALKTELVLALKAELAHAEAAYVSTRAGATHEEAKPENDKDTRALEQTYLARGQATRVEELRIAVGEVEAMLVPTANEGTPIGVGMVATVEDQDGKEHAYFVALHGGGAKLQGGAVQSVTSKSPLGRALVGKRIADDVEVVIAGKTRSLAIVRVD